MGKKLCIGAALAAIGSSLLAAGPAEAHMVSADVGDFYAGLLHPLTSLEHLLPTLALAFLASQCGRRAGRLVLLLFPAALMAGVLAGARLPAPAVAFAADALGLVVLGGLVMAAPRLGEGTRVVSLAATVMGLVLGWRSGGDFALSPAGWQFVPGVAVTGFVLVAVVAAWVPRMTAGSLAWLRIVLGAGFLVVGGLMLGLGFAGGGLTAGRLPGLPSEDRLRDLALSPTPSPALVALALLGAMAWGAGHALTPGHGKALVGAYLVGARGTFGQALALGATVTVTHTLGVFLLGGVAYVAAGSFDQERFFPWLALASGLGVLAVGATLAVRRLRQALGDPNHDHGHCGDRHDHAHGGHGHSHGGILSSHGHGDGDCPGGEPPSWRTLVALGVSGGLLPCPAALILMLGAISIGRVGFGLGLVAAFSLGLAGVLTVVGLLFIKGARLLEKTGGWAFAARWLPLVGALAVTLLGLVVSLEALFRLLGG